MRHAFRFIRRITSYNVCYTKLLRTGLVIITSGAWTAGVSGAALTSQAFASSLPVWGNYLVALSLALFAFTTIIGWSVYGERCVTYLFRNNFV